MGGALSLGRRRSLAVLAALAGATCALACAQGRAIPEPGRGALEGTVRLVPREGAPGSRGSSSYGDRRMRDVELVDYSQPGFVIVYLDRAPAPGDAARARERAEIAIEPGATGPRLVPQLAALSVGGSLVVENRTHAALALSLPALARVELLAPGAKLEVAIEQSGPVELFLVGTREHATLWSSPGPWVRTDAAGRFAFPDVEPGRAVVRAWHPRFPSASRAVDVRAGAVETVELEIGVGRDTRTDAAEGGAHAAH